MSRATQWILVGLVLVAAALLIAAFAAAADSPAWNFLAVALGLPGLFAAQIGVIALAVRIGTWELHEALSERSPQ